MAAPVARPDEKLRGIFYLFFHRMLIRQSPKNIKEKNALKKQDQPKKLVLFHFIHFRDLFY